MTVDAHTWPLPRRRRGGPPTNLEVAAISSGSNAPTPPRTRVFPFLLVCANNARRTISTPILQGPAILRRLEYWQSTVSDPPQQTLEVGWSPNVVSENGVALTTVRPYTILTEKVDPFGVTAAATGAGFPYTTFTNTHVNYEYTLDLIVTEARFCFVLSVVNNTVSGDARHGHMVVLENVNADALNLFTGS